MDLQQGSRGMNVRIAQQLLNDAALGGSRLDPDGIFGPLTFKSVEDFQNRRKLEVDGVVGPSTWAALKGQAPVNSTQNASGQGGSTPRSVVAAPLGRPKPSPVPAPHSVAPAAAEPPLNPALEPAWMKVAMAELGIHERTGKGTARIIMYHQATTLHAKSDQVAWCSSFVNWCLAQVGVTGTRSAAAASWAGWGTELKTPRLGCIVQLHHHQKGYAAATGTSSGNHVAFFVHQDAAHIRLLGGNQSDSVKYSDFALAKWSVKTYRWPSGA